jgi:hypothetical protein
MEDADVEAEPAMERALVTREDADFQSERGDAGLRLDAAVELSAAGMEA